MAKEAVNDGFLLVRILRPLSMGLLLDPIAPSVFLPCAFVQFFQIPLDDFFISLYNFLGHCSAFLEFAVVRLFYQRHRTLFAFVSICEAYGSLSTLSGGFLGQAVLPLGNPIAYKNAIHRSLCSAREKCHRFQKFAKRAQPRRKISHGVIRCNTAPKLLEDKK